MAGISRGNFVEHSLSQALSFFRSSVFFTDYPRREGFLQSVDPRAKTISVFLLILACAFSHSAAQVMGLYALCCCLALASRIELGFFLIRTLGFVPLFSLFISVPALFSSFSPGEPLLAVTLPWGAGPVVTRQGVLWAVLFISRVTASVSFVTLLSLTTGHTELLRALRCLGIPQLFVLIAAICYRYIYLFAETVWQTYTAVKSRVGSAVSRKKGQRIVAWNIANLWGRSVSLNQEVYNAMLSRGFSQEPRLLHSLKSRPRDWLWLTLCALISVFVVAGV